MTILHHEDSAYAKYIKQTRYEGCIEDRQAAWDIAWEMLWDAVHSETLTRWREYDHLTSLIGKAHEVMEPFTDYFFSADDGEWLVLEDACIPF